MINNPTKEDCMKCFDQYRIDRTFNHDCSVYQEQSKISDKYKDKCVWLQIFENDLEKLADGDDYLTFSGVKGMEKYHK